MRFFVLLWFLAWAANSAKGADFTCADEPARGIVIENKDWIPAASSLAGPFMWQGEYKDSACWLVAIEGKIASGDAEKLEWLLTGGSAPTRHFLLLSPGGNVLEAMTMGRILRVRFASVKASFNAIDSQFSKKKIDLCGIPGQPVCCASACALLYFGGAHWNQRDYLGLHRPTLEDLGERDYSEARKTLQEAGAMVQQYLKEMEVNISVYEAMMQAGPDQLVLKAVGKDYPPSMQDWLSAKCNLQFRGTNPAAVDKELCISSAFEEFSRERRTPLAS